MNRRDFITGVSAIAIAAAVPALNADMPKAETTKPEKVYRFIYNVKDGTLSPARLAA